MRHQPLVGAMEAAKLRLVAGEGLVADEQLGVAGEARIRRVAPEMKFAAAPPL